MKGLAAVSRGIEEIALREITELIDAKCEKKELCVTFDFEDFSDLCLLCYKAQSVDRILFLLSETKFEKLADIEKTSQNPELKKWISGRKFKVECERHGKHDFRSVDVTELALAQLSQNWNASCDFRNPDVILFHYIVEDKCYFGIDFSGFELNKRPYKIFLHSNSIRGTIAYALIRMAGYGRESVLLDPFSKDGVIAIEACMFACNFPVNYYKKDRFAFLKLPLEIDFQKFLESVDKKIYRENTKINCFDSTFRHVDYCKKNSKIAGIDKMLNFSRTELEWLDIKFKENEVDIIATSPPVLKGPIQDKVYNEFFYQSEYILSNKGVLAIATTIPEVAKKHASKYKLKLSDEKAVWSGEQQMHLLFFTKPKFKNINNQKSQK